MPVIDPSIAALKRAEYAAILKQQCGWGPSRKWSSESPSEEEMALFGWRPFSDEPDPRPLPEGRIAAGVVADMFDAMVSCLSDTRLEPDLEDLLWGITNVFHRAAERVERELDDNEVAQKRLQREQDGSEVKSVDLERHLREGLTLLERRDAMEFFRDACADQFRLHTRNAWTPRSGSKLNRKALTAAMVDSRDFIHARKCADRELLVPTGTRIAISSGPAFSDVDFLWKALDRIHAKYPDMVLLHGATPTGGERIAARWADHRGVTTVAFKPDWGKFGRAAPFKRNDEMLSLLPKGVIVLPGTGIQDNLFDKARTMGLRCWDFRQGGGA